MTIPTLPDGWRSFLGFAGYDYICEMDRKERYCDVSANYERLLGCSKDVLIGKSPFVEGIIHPEDIAMVREQLRPLFERDEFVRLEYRFRVPDGKWAWGESSGQAFLNARGEWRCIFITRDITERKEMEASLSASEGDYRALIEHAVDGVLLADTQGKVIRANARLSALTGYTGGELLGEGIGLLFSEQELGRVPLRFDLLDGEHEVRSERMLTRKDGRTVPVEMSTLRLPDGRYQAFIRDITERREAHAALQASEQRYRLIFDCASLGIFHFDQQGVIRLCNDVFLQQMGSTRDAVVGLDMIHDLQNPGVVDALRVALQGGRGQFEGPYTSVTGARQGVFKLHTYGLSTGEGSSIGGIGIVEEVTAQRAAEQALRESEDRFRGLFENTTDSIFWIAVEAGGAFRYEGANPAHRILTGLAGEQIVGRTPQDCFPPDQAARLVANYQRCLAEGHPITYEELADSGHGTRELETLLVPIRDAEGRTYRLVGTSRDVTESKTTQEAMRRAQKLESLGVLAGGIAHDFNNLLTAILGNLNLAQRRCPPESAAKPYLDAVEGIVFKASDLTRQMLAYSGRGQFVVRSHDLNSLVREMAKLLEVSMSKRIGLDLQLSPEPAVIEADGAQIQQVILNLVTNAADAIGDQNGEIVICTSVRQLDAPANEASFTGKKARPGRYVSLQVRDTGCGIHPDVMDRIFDPFFTTKSAGRGLGLSAMLGILRGHEAGYRIRSEQGKGTTFEVLFPASECVEEPVEKRHDTQSHDVRGTVLLVDDEREIVEALQDALETFGLRVLTAMDGLEAVEVFRQNMSIIDLVLMDLSMPRMDGREAIQELRKLQPGVRVILSSGFSAQSIHEFLADGTVGFLQKPYRLEDLRAAISSRLAR